MATQERRAVYRALIEYRYQPYTKNDDFIKSRLPSGPSTSSISTGAPPLSSVEFAAETERIANRENERLDKDWFGTFSRQTEEVLTQALPADLQATYDLNVSVRMLHTSKGSLEVYYEICVVALSTIALYKDFNESLELIRSQSERILRMFLNRVSGERLVTGATTVQVDLFSNSGSSTVVAQDPVVSPTSAPAPITPVENKVDLAPPSDRPISITLPQQVIDRPIRDDFFYYLLIFAIIEFIIIILLVSGAVIHTYF